MIYLDNSATTLPAPDVLRRMEDLRARSFANASSIHRGGQAARVELEDAREHLAGALGAEAKEVIFTSGGTEANNFALKGYLLRSFMERGAWPHLLTTRVEHHAVLHPADFLARLGAPVHLLDVDAEGRLRPETLADALASLDRAPGAAPPLVSVMHANNETGAINPIAELAGIAHDHGALLHSDAVQTFGKLGTKLVELGADMLSISAHKLHGPKGIGALYLSKNVEVEPIIHGGAQERNRRGGTESVELVVGFDEAISLAEDSPERTAAHIAELSALLRRRLAGIDRLRFVTAPEGTLPNIVSVTFDDAERLDGEALIVGMDLRGVAVSNGSACTSGSPQPSHVLLAMGYAPEQARAAVRFSLSRYTTGEEISGAVDALEDVLRTMRR